MIKERAWWVAETVAGFKTILKRLHSDIDGISLVLSTDSLIHDYTYKTDKVTIVK